MGGISSGIIYKHDEWIKFHHMVHGVSHSLPCGRTVLFNQNEIPAGKII